MGKKYSWARGFKNSEISSDLSSGTVKMNSTFPNNFGQSSAALKNVDSGALVNIPDTVNYRQTITTIIHQGFKVHNSLSMKDLDNSIWQRVGMVSCFDIWRDKDMDVYRNYVQ